MKVFLAFTFQMHEEKTHTEYVRREIFHRIRGEHDVDNKTVKELNR
mgnify:CR=1 FL=1